ncbi:hypothetical protein ON010_g1092 [Phytophthora cinnamomi]|nr:hypothetical protein ON010_g1092 [Phytophthora cinnamomi]
MEDISAAFRSFDGAAVPRFCASVLKSLRLTLLERVEHGPSDTHLAGCATGAITANDSGDCSRCCGWRCSDLHVNSVGVTLGGVIAVQQKALEPTLIKSRAKRAQTRVPPGFDSVSMREPKLPRLRALLSISFGHCAFGLFGVSRGYRQWGQRHLVAVWFWRGLSSSMPCMDLVASPLTVQRGRQRLRLRAVPAAESTIYAWGLVPRTSAPAPDVWPTETAPTKFKGSGRGGGYTDADLAGYPDFTDKWPSANNDDVTTVSTIDVSSAVTTFIMSGGSADVNYPQGKVASVTLTADFISAATAVTKVMLENLDLDGEIESLSSLLPSTVEYVELDNTLLSKFPAKLGDLTSLQQLILDYNYITSVDSLDVIDSITTLSLESNSIESFTGVFANLEYLLETLVLSDSDFVVDLDCEEMEQVKVQDVTVCLSDGVATSSNRASASSAAGVDGSDTQSTSAADSSLSASLIVGIVLGF